MNRRHLSRPTSQLWLLTLVCALSVGALGCDDDPETITVFETVPAEVFVQNPSPSIGEGDVALEGVTLSWEVVDGAEVDAFRVFFSADAADVDAASGGDGALVEETGELSVALSAALAPKTTHFWRVDSVKEGVTFLGPVWSFTTEDVVGPQLPQATSGPNPANGAVDVALDTGLDWADAEGADSYQVFFSDDLSAVTEGRPEALVGEPEDSAQALEGPLEAERAYFWRVDSVNAEGTTTGPLWAFSTVSLVLPGPFGVINPQAGEEGVALDPTFEWEDSPNAQSYNIYVDTALLEVLMADEASPAFVGNTEDTEFALEEAFATATAYFWRVDALNDAGVRRGSVQVFTTLPPELPGAVVAVAPADGALEVELEGAELVWEGGESAEHFEVYLGTDPREVFAARPDGPLHLGSFEGPGVSLGDAIDFDTAYFWRVDGVNFSGTTFGEVFTFATDAETLAPVFRGVRSATVIGGSALRVDWALAVDDDDLREDLSYEVFVAGTSGAQDFEAPTAIVAGLEDSVVLDGPEIEALLEGESVHVVVRVLDTEDHGDVNTAEVGLPVPGDGLARIFVDGAAAEGGDGSQGAPINDLAVALTQAVDEGGVLLVSEGRYEIDPLTFEGSQSEDLVVVYGGFPSWEGVEDGLDEAGLLALQDDEAHPTVVVNNVEEGFIAIEVEEGSENRFDEVLDSTHTLSLQLDGRWTVLGHLRFEDATTRTLQLRGGQFTITGCAFISDFEPRFFFGYEGFQSGAIELYEDEVGTIGELALVGNTFRNHSSALLYATTVAGLNVAGNEFVDVTAVMDHNIFFTFVPGDVEQEGDSGTYIEEELGLFAVPETGLTMRFESNLIRRTRREGFHLHFEGREDGGGPLDIQIMDNVMRGMYSATVFELVNIASLGEGGSAAVTMKRNDLVGAQNEVLEIRYIEFDFDEELEQDIPEQMPNSPMTVEVRDNRFIHVNDNIIAIDNFLPIAGEVVRLDVHDNVMALTESEMIDVFSFFFDEDDPLGEAPYGVGGAFEVSVTGNHFASADETLELGLRNIVDGRIEVEYSDNVSLRDNGNCVDIDIEGFYGAPGEENPTTDMSFTFLRNHCVSEDDGFEIDTDAVRGHITGLFEDNFVEAEQEGLRWNHDLPDTFFDEEAEEEFLIYDPTGGEVDITIRRTTIICETDAIEVRMQATAPGSSLLIEDNHLVSTDDTAIDASVFDVQTTTIINNVGRSFDDDNLEFDLFSNNEGFYAPNFDWPMDVVIFNNDVHTAIRENLDVNLSPSRLADGSPREVNAWIAHNDAFGNTESEALDVDARRGASMLIERNIAGLNDVDSSDALEASCSGVHQVIVRNNMLVYGAGGGIETSNCVIQSINNTLSANDRDTGSRAGLEVATTEIIERLENGNERTLESFTQSFILNNVSAGNNFEDIDGNMRFAAIYSLLGELENGEPGFESLIEDPLFKPCADPFDFVECFSVLSESATLDAGHPGDDYLDLDGTRNDMGVFGGPHAGELGYLDGVVELPLVPMALRPLTNLNTGASEGLEDRLALIFTRPVDASTLNSDTVEVLNLSNGGAAIPGTWSAVGNRATFVADSDFPAGSHFEVRVQPGGVSTPEGLAVARPYQWRASTGTDPGVEVEPNDTVEDANALEGDRDDVTGDLNPYLEDDIDAFSFEAEAGQRLMARVFMGAVEFEEEQFELRFDFEMRLIGPDGETVLDFSQDLFEPNDAELSDRLDRVDPFIDFVFTTGGTYTLLVQTQLPNNEEGLPELGEGDNPEDFTLDYRLSASLESL